MATAAQNAKADAQARAEGWDSRSQRYRGRKLGFKSAAEYQAAVEVRRNPDAGVVRKAARGLLLGGMTTRAGTVIAADWSNDENWDQWRAINRYGSTRRLTITVEMDNGDVFHLGAEHGGYRLQYVRALVARFGGGGDGWAGAVSYLLDLVKSRSYKKNPNEPDEPDDEEGPEPLIVTVTIV